MGSKRSTGATVYGTANVLVFVYFAVDRREEAMWSLLTILGGVIAYGFLSRYGGRVGHAARPEDSEPHL